MTPANARRIWVFAQEIGRRSFFTGRTIVFRSGPVSPPLLAPARKDERKWHKYAGPFTIGEEVIQTFHSALGSPLRRTQDQEVEGHT